MGAKTRIELTTTTTTTRTATTANAILGVLALRPSWSTWELTKQLGRNMRFFWPRAESRIYEEALRLEREGLAKAVRSHVGKRPRTTYSITAKGRRTLAAWMATPPKTTTLECEPLLRVMVADLGTIADLRSAVAQVRVDADAILDVGRIVGAEYLEGRGPFQDDVHVRAFVFDFLTHHALAMRAWSDRTAIAIDAWEGASDDDRDAAAIQTIRSCLSAYPPAQPPATEPVASARA